MTGSRWALTAHACRHCLGRVLESDGSFTCADCGATAGEAPEMLCACGVQTEGGRRPFRCTLNTSPSPANPSVVVVTAVEAVAF